MNSTQNAALTAPVGTAPVGTAPVSTAPRVDLWLLLASLFLLALGLLMVGSASLPAAAETARPWKYVQSQSFAALVGLGCGLGAFCLAPRFWRRFGLWLLLAALLLLVLVLIPGVGRQVGGSRRWLELFGFSLQVSELAKLASVIYLAGFLHRYAATAPSQRSVGGPLLLLALSAGLLLMEPDYGMTALLLATALVLLFIAGVEWRLFGALFFATVVALGLLLYSADYRWLRFLCFLDPWGKQYECGYQLTQSLIAIGLGGWSGVGLGASVQKHHYLPEAHNDFLFAILAEELGLAGVIGVVALYAIIVWRCLRISARAERQGYLFAAYLAFGVGFLIGLQALINMGVNMGLLPTKGLTLPLLSYGGSSVVAVCVALGIVLRLDWELRLGAASHPPPSSITP